MKADLSQAQNVEHKEVRKVRSLPVGLLLIGIALLAVNLRVSITSVGPLLAAIQVDTGLSGGLAGLLTALPPLGFAALSYFAPLLARRWGMERILFVSLIVLASGILLRSWPSLVTLFLGTAILGLAIAVGNVLLPSLSKRDFPRYAGVMTGLYSGVMGAGAAFASGVSVPIAQLFGLGWRGSLAFWALPALLSACVWAAIAWLSRAAIHVQVRAGQEERSGGKWWLWRSALAWQVTLFMGLQSLSFYAVVAWLPALLRDEGLSSTTAGWLVALLQVLGFLSSILTPILIGRRSNQRLIVLVVGLFGIAAFLGFLTTGSSLVVVWITVLGIAQGASLSLALIFFVTRTPDASSAAELSGMAQSIGYLVSASGPILFGFLHDLTHNWVASLSMLIFVTLVLVFVGLGAGRNVLITQSRS